MPHDQLTPGDSVIISAVITDNLGAAVTSQVHLKIRPPGSSTYTDITGTLVYTALTNTWAATYLLAVAGIYHYRWESVGPAVGSAEAPISVSESRV
jgi:hypothetical protein